VKKLAVCLVAVAAGVSAAACGSLGPTAATVNGTRISQEAVEEELEAIGANAAYRESIEPQIGAPILGEGRGTFSATFAAQVLTRQIFFELVRQEVARRSLGVPRDALDQALGQAEEQVGGAEVFRQFPSSYRETLVRHFAHVNVLREALVEEAEADAAAPDARAYYDTHPDEFVERCMSHVLVETGEQAAEVRRRVLAGEDFGTVAVQASTDPSAQQNRGELPCGRSGTYVPEFEQAAAALDPGQVSEPVQTQFGFHVILLRSERVVAFEEVESQLQAQLANDAQQASQGALDEFLREAVSKARVSVNPKYGRWVDDGPAQPHVEPPEGVPGGDDDEDQPIDLVPE
jgi:parvulin-like peptidyl-prolyl isomerase